MNLPNYITTVRIFAVPLLIWILSSNYFYGKNGEQELLASGVFILASVTDGLDGYLARRRKQVTTLGMLLDPLPRFLFASRSTLGPCVRLASNPRASS